jgi:hypothetical protein
MRSSNSSFCYLMAALLIAGNLCLQRKLVAQETRTMSRVVAPTPPMGWNSWDSYGLRINEQQFRENVEAMATKLKPFGYTYAVIDEGWYMVNPEDRPKPDLLKYAVDENGRFIPMTVRFPSALQNGRNAGFQDLANLVHAKGLKFGVHIIRGIPRESVVRNLPIDGSAFKAQDAADQNDACPWDPTSWGIKDTAAGQAWYDSLLRQYATWGVDFLKVDCIADHPYKASEIQQIKLAEKRSRHRAESLAGTNRHRASCRSRGLCPDVAHIERHLGPLDWQLGLPHRHKEPVRKRCTLGSIYEARKLAGRGHAAGWVADAASGMGRGKAVGADRGRAADGVYAVGDCAVAADSGGEFDQAGWFYAGADYEQGSDRHKPGGSEERRSVHLS